jgi:hypothetical protein
MATLVSERIDQPWLRRLYLPSYQIAEAAKYAGISSQTVAAWHKEDRQLLSDKERPESMRAIL